MNKNFRNSVCLISLLFALAGYAGLDVVQPQPSDKTDQPSSNDRGFIPTLNKFGWMSTDLDSISESFLSFSKSQKLPVLDIGTAYGHTAQLALSHGSKVIANDMEPKHLSVLWDKVPLDQRKNLQLDSSRFPNQMEFAPQSLGAVLACRVFHFLSGEELEIGVRKIYSWLAPGGKVFVFANAPFRKNLSAFLKEYSERKSSVRYPGVVTDMQVVDPAQGDQLPSFFHFLDVETLTRLFTEAGFKIERAEYVRIENLPERSKLDGRENVGIIAVKPE